VPGFVDIHSHVIPSGDDGAQTLEQGLALCREAAHRGTRVLYGTPHVWAFEPLGSERERTIRANHREMAAKAAGFDLELRLGFELSPCARLLDEDLRRYAFTLAGVRCVLVEFPFEGSADIVLAVASHAEGQGLRPLLAHPERADCVLEGPELLDAFLERGWPLQVNATSLLGRHGSASAELGWMLVERGAASFVASDGHGPARPPYLDEAYAAVLERAGPQLADRLFDGGAVGEPPVSARVAQRASG